MATEPTDTLHIDRTPDQKLHLRFSGVWRIGSQLPAAADVITNLESGQKPNQIVFDAHQIKEWDSKLLTFLNSIEN